MKRKLINILGLTGLLALLSYAAAVVLLSIVSLTLLIVSGFRKNGVRSLGVFAIIALAMMLVGAVGQKLVPPVYFGIAERFSVFAAVGFTAVLGLYLFSGFKKAPREYRRKRKKK